MTPCLIPDDKLPIILAVVIPIVVLAVFAGVFAWWMWRRNKDKKMANKGDYVKLYNQRYLFEPSVLNVQNKQYRRNFGKGLVQTPTFIMHASILNNFTQIAHITGNTCICIINDGAVRICHQNLIPLILKALLGNYRPRCYKLVNFKNKISRLSN